MKFASLAPNLASSRCQQQTNKRRLAPRQAGRRAGGQAGSCFWEQREAGRQADRQACKQADGEQRGAERTGLLYEPFRLSAWRPPRQMMLFSWVDRRALFLVYVLRFDYSSNKALVFDGGFLKGSSGFPKGFRICLSPGLRRSVPVAGLPPHGPRHEGAGR